MSSFTVTPSKDTSLVVGKTTITVTAGGKTKSFTLTVGRVAATKLMLNKSKATVMKGKRVTITATTWNGKTAKCVVTVTR